jgi:gamma-tubulin complex component 3
MALLDDESQNHLMHQRAIYNRILEFQSVFSRLCVATIPEAEAIFEDAHLVRHRARSRQYGTNAEQEARVRIRKIGLSGTIEGMKSQMKIVSQRYQDMVHTFLMQLAVSSDQSLQCLSFRVDFNQHHKRWDARGAIHQFSRIILNSDC